MAYSLWHIAYGSLTTFALWPMVFAISHKLMRFDKQNRQLLEGQGLPCPQVGAQHAAPLQTRYPLPDLIVKIH